MKQVPLEDVWPGLSEAVIKLLDEPQAELSPERWMSLHNDVVSYCTASTGSTATGSGARFRGGELYEALADLLDTRMALVAERCADVRGENLLHFYRDHWKDFQMSSKVIHHIFMYMNRYWLRRQREEAQSAQKDVYSVQELCNVKWRHAFFDAIKARLLQALLEEVERERNSEDINQTLLKDVILSMVQMAFRITNNTSTKEVVLDIYEAEFEQGFLQATELFYVMESSTFLESNTCSDYMKKVETRLAQEEARVGQYLHNSTAGQLMRTCENVLIKHHMDKIQAEFPEMLNQDKLDDLARLYNLLARIDDGLDPLRAIFKNHVRDDGLARLAALEADDGGKKVKQDFKPYVECLMEIHDKYYGLVMDVFQGDKGFHTEMNKAFDHFMNLPNNRSPEFLSLYIDDKLRKGLKGVTEDEIDAIIDKCLVLFKRLEEKDMFERYYKTHLSKRLLHGRSASDDQERNVIAKLKTECGTSFTHKLEGMFKDMQLSKDIMEEFKKREAAKKLGLDLSVQVLTSGFWPTQTAACSLPPEILACCRAFEQFYLSAHSGRRVTWQTGLGQAELKASFGKKSYLVSLSTTQMAILLLYNDADALGYPEIRDATQLEDNALKRDLLALSCAKYKLLTKDPKSKKISQNDVFAFSEKFTSKQFKFKIAQVVVKESDKDRSRTITEQNKDREFMIDAAIVRTMKARKTLDHNTLVGEVISQLQNRFQPNLNSIKRQIEKLIEREYLERNPDNRKQYNYLA